MARTALLLSLAALLFASEADAATRSFVTIVDDDTLAAKKIGSVDLVTDTVMTGYDKSGMKRPDVISVWTTFPMDGNTVETLFDPLANDVKGIGLEAAYGGDGTFTSSYAPTRAILLHNDFTALESRAKLEYATPENFARYLFLLELTHVWGPQVKIPGATPNQLIGFDFHWSFWMDAGGSPAGGNDWRDNGDGSFTVKPQTPTSIRYSMLDLYLMGLAAPSEVPPFGVLENAVPPTSITDPLAHDAPYGPASFPYFGTAPFTVQATRKTVTVQDVIAATGARTPDHAEGALTLGVVLVVKPTATKEEIAAFEEKFEPIAATLAPAFHDATHERGSFTLVTSHDVADPAPAPSEDPTPAEEPTPTTTPAATTTTTGGCDVASSSFDFSWLVVLGLAVGIGRRRLTDR